MVLLIQVLIVLLVFGLVLYVARIGFAAMGLDPAFIRIINVVVVVLFIIWVLYELSAVVSGGGGGAASHAPGRLW